MKKLVLIGFIGLSVTFCKVESTKKYKELKARKDSIEQINIEREKTINEFISSMNEIEENLKEIKRRESIVTVTTESKIENPIEVKDKIKDDIQLIVELINKNKKLYNELKRKLEASRLKIQGLKKLVAHLKERIYEQNLQIEELKLKLAKQNIIIEDLVATVDTLALANEQKSIIIRQQEKQIYTAYYVLGTEKELIAHNILSKQGGFLGIGKNKVLKSNFNQSYFTKIDIRKTKVLSLFKKKVKIITPHPDDSYKLRGKDRVDSLIITNPEKFWKATKYLVIIVD